MSKPEEERERLGIPQHVGIFYAMGLALFVEGIMSGCYHVCPSYNNFQFGMYCKYNLPIYAVYGVWWCFCKYYLYCLVSVSVLFRHSFHVHTGRFTDS